jgi:hypothetical protein
VSARAAALPGGLTLPLPRLGALRRAARVFVAGAAIVLSGARPLAASERPDPTPSSIQVGRYRLQSHPWVNLHQRLLYESRFDDATPLPLTPEDTGTWKKAVEAYRAFVGKRSPIFDAELKAMNDALSAIPLREPRARDLPKTIPPPAAAALAAAMPVYLKEEWRIDDRANRFWIAVAEPLLASAGEELALAHSKAYGVPFPKRVLVDVTSWAWEFGSYTVGPPDAAHAVIASIVPGNQGFASLEILMHEASHVIVDPGPGGAIGADIERASAELGVKAPGNLWHAILFYTSSELTRRALAARGVADYHMIVKDMYARGFKGYQQALESHWQAFLDGKLTREEAIKRIVGGTGTPKRSTP